MKRALAISLDFQSVTLCKGRKKQEGNRPAIVFRLTIKSVGKCRLPGWCALKLGPPVSPSAALRGLM